MEWLHARATPRIHNHHPDENGSQIRVAARTYHPSCPASSHTPPRCLPARRRPPPSAVWPASPAGAAASVESAASLPPTAPMKQKRGQVHASATKGRQQTCMRAAEAGQASGACMRVLCIRRPLRLPAPSARTSSRRACCRALRAHVSSPLAACTALRACVTGFAEGRHRGLGRAKRSATGNGQLNGQGTGQGQAGRASGPCCDIPLACGSNASERLSPLRSQVARLEGEGHTHAGIAGVHAWRTMKHGPFHTSASTAFSWPSSSCSFAASASSSDA